MRRIVVVSMLSLSAATFIIGAQAADRFEGKYFRGAGDVEYLQLLDIARRMFAPDPEFQNLPMLYMPAWKAGDVPHFRDYYAPSFRA
jgi:hypothetical protein